MTITKYHKDFKLQGKSFNSIDELVEFSKEISFEITSFLQNWFDAKLYVEVKTSGSTGTPKVIQLQKQHMINSALLTGGFFGLSEKTSALLCMSPSFIAGKMMLVRALVLGWEIDIIEPISNPLEKLKKYYDFSAMVPIQLFNSLPYLHKVKKLIVGGGVVSNELLNKIQHVETEIFATYGMTETITHIAIIKLNNFEFIISSKEEKSYYKLLPNIKITKDKRGCLIVDAPKISNEKIITNDLVEIISDSEFKWLGRYDSIINSGGLKLIPEQIEEKFSKIIQERFFVTGIPDVILGEKLVLVIEGENNNNVLLNAVKNLSSISKFEKPKEIYFIPKFIETPTKKINRKETTKLIKSIY